MEANPEVVLREYREADLYRVLEIAVAAWAPIYAAYRDIMGDVLFETVFPGWRDEKKRQVEGACRSGSGVCVLVAESGDRVVGFITYYRDPDRKTGEIGNNAVDPEYQNRGIATLMYRHVLDRMRESGLRWARVTTGGDPSHAPARRAYEKAGFTAAIPSVTYHVALDPGDGD